MGFELVIKTFQGETFNIKDLEATSTFGNLIDKVFSLLPKAPSKESIQLVHNGQPINKDNNSALSGKTLQSLNIGNKQHLFVVFRVIGG